MMKGTMSKAKTFGELKASGYKEKTVKVEMAENLAQKLRNKETLFPFIHGYENTVIPQLINAVLSGHNIVFLGEKGQAKSRIMRSLTSLLDEEIPILTGTEIPESPFAPITAKGKFLISDLGNDAPIHWIGREERYGERLAPGAKIADIIGDIDPSKIINGEPLSSEGAIFFGLLPRMNRGIFAVNEMPDLDYLVQVSLFNILEEADIQIRGIPVRFPIDVVVCFTANPEDYSRSGKIISQLKDRIGSEIRTHYPKSRKIGLDITRQEIHLPIQSPTVSMPPFVEEIIEEITIQARSSHLVNQKSGVSARLSIANYEVAVSSARKRALMQGEDSGVVRVTDLGNLFASCSGKIELDPYRDEAISEYQVVSKLLDSATKVVFEEYYPPKKHSQSFNDIAKQIYKLGKLEISDQMPLSNYKDLLKDVPALWDLLHEKGYDLDESLFATGIEFILEGLTANQKLSRRRLGEISAFKAVDAY
jgi:magnesium chelatase subunit I